MKTIMALQVLQLITIVLLLTVVLQRFPPEQGQWPATDSSAVVDPVEVERPEPSINTSTLSDSAGDSIMSATERRSIEAFLRRELTDMQAQLTAEIRSIQHLDTLNEAEVVSEQQMVDQQIQHDLVQQELDYYIEQGVISDQQMSKLQLEIAKLSQEGQKEAMRRLVRAMNAGQLDGHL